MFLIQSDNPMKSEKFFRIKISQASLVLLFMAVVPARVVAQNPDSATETPMSVSAKSTNFRFGIHASPNISYLSTKAVGVETPANVKFGFGLMAIFYFAENYGFASGLNIISRGGELRLPTDSSLYQGDYSSQFLQIPLQLRMSTREFGYSTFFATFGGSIDLKLSEEINFDPQLNPEADSYVNFFNAMFVIGAGMEYSLGGNTSLIGGIYYHQSLLNNLSKDPVYDLIDKNKTYRFDYISVQFGILF